MTSDPHWNAFLAYVRLRLEGKAEVFVHSEDLVEACAFHRPFWDSLEARWTKEPQPDFNYEGQAPSRSFEAADSPYEPTIVRFWRKV